MNDLKSQTGKVDKCHFFEDQENYKKTFPGTLDGKGKSYTATFDSWCVHCKGSTMHKVMSEICCQCSVCGCNYVAMIGIAH